MKNTGASTVVLSRLDKKACQNITVIGVVNAKVLNTLKVTDIDGKICFGDFSLINQIIFHNNF